MVDSESYTLQQLRDASKSTGAAWAVWLFKRKGSYHCLPASSLSKVRQDALHAFLAIPQNNAWLSGSMGSGYTRTRATGEFASRLGGGQLYAYPNIREQGILLVCAEKLEKLARDLFRLLAMGGTSEQVSPKIPTDGELSFRSFERGLETPYETDKVLTYVLNSVLEIVPADAAYLAIRSGDEFAIAQIQNLPEGILGTTISLTADRVLAQMVESLHGLILHSAALPENLHPFVRSQVPVFLEVMRIPIILGKRVLGEVCLFSHQMGYLSEHDLLQLTRQISRAAHAIENAMVFAEAVRYLQQFTLLNDLAMAASGGVSTDEVARKVVNRLKRSFNTQHVAVLLLSPDGKRMLEYGSDRGGGKLIVPVDTSLAGYVLENQQVVRVGDIRKAPRYLRHTDPTESALFVPLRYRGVPIGVLGLESDHPNAFTNQDEQLMVLVASHLSGIFENAKLHQEARERAGKLALIHEVINRVLGLREEHDIAQEAADLIASYFRFDIAAVMVADETSQYLVSLGIGGSMGHTAMTGTRYSIHDGVTGKVFNTGLSLLVNDFSDEHFSDRPSREEEQGQPLVEWRAGSQICVALREREKSFGLIIVEQGDPESFSDSDLIILESLAGILSSVLINARRYRELKERIEAQQLAENRLVRSSRLAAVGEMAAGVAHELNNPLTTVMGFLELALDDVDRSSRLYEDLDLALSEAHRAREVVRRLLDFSRQTSNVFIRTSLNELVQDVMPLVQHQMQTKGVVIEFSPAEFLPEVSANPNQIKQVILNLLQNALQSMPEGGHLRVMTGREYRSEGEGVFVKVCDTGEGIPPENYERIFEPFFTTRPVGQGTGLGLSVSYGIITSHGGLIDVDSIMGRGSCFTVWLPCNQPG